jgi:GT2 family glycosyltransferase
VSYATAGRRWQAIVLSWNGREDTLRCLTSLRTLGDELNVICVDNGSVDGTAAAVREQFPEVTLIEAGSNLGYSGGNNLGIRHALEAGARWVMLVNNDATVEADVTDGFEAAAQSRPDAGILAGTVLTTDEPICGSDIRAVRGAMGGPMARRTPGRSTPTGRSAR